MKRLSLILILQLFVAFAWSQNDTTFCARIVEAESDEPIPLVGVYVANDNTTLTNFEGEFCITAQPDDTIRFTCAGRKTLYIRADRLPATIKMEMLASSLSEVTVKGYEGTLMQISKKMEKAFNSKRRKTARYFYRQTQVIGLGQDIVEAFVDAKSSVNLRDLQFVSGRHGSLTRQQWEKSGISYMNLHHVMELGPMTREAYFWNSLLAPLISKEDFGKNHRAANGKIFDVNSKFFGYDYYQRVYNISITNLDDEDGQHLYRIDLARREDLQTDFPLMTGTLYVDRSSLRVMAFDGKVENLTIEFRRTELESPLTAPVALNFHIDYRYDHDYPEVADLGMHVEFSHFMSRTLVFNVEEQKNVKKSNKKSKAEAGENMLVGIAKVGYDSIFWANNEVIKRTADEQRIAQNTVEREQAVIDSANAARQALPPLERLADRLTRFGQAVPQEKVFVQMDNTCYFLGDTIWFSAFTRRTDIGKPSRISRVLYVELLNHDGYLVERKLVEMLHGRGSGFFALPDTLYSGFFELRAYTKWQLNWGQTEHNHVKETEDRFFNKAMAQEYFRDYEKLYSRVFPVYDKPREPGDFVRDMTLRPLRRQFKNEAPPPELMLSLFPEGGNVVVGMPCRVAFEAALSDGEYCEGTVSLLMKNEKIKIKNDENEDVTEVMTENRGRGSFIFTPEEGKSYEAVFTSSDGKTARQKIKDFEKEGVSLQVNRQGDEWVFNIHTNLEKPLGLTIMHEGVTSRFAQIENEKFLNESSVTSAERKIKNEELKAGINQVTIFDEEGRVWADRLFFVTKPELTKPTIAVSGLKEEYKPFEPIVLDVKCQVENVNTPLLNREGTGVSLAVRDAVHQDNTFDSGNIMTEMLLSSEIKGFVPQPEWFFEKDDNEHRRGLDLLMMTQGWRRFSWQDMAVAGLWDITYPSEHTQMVTGSVNNYYVDEPVDEAPDFASLQSDPMKKSDFTSFSAAGGDNVVGDFDAVVEAGRGFATNGRANKARNPRFLRHSNLKREVTVHAEFVPIGGGKGIEGEAMTKQGQFKMDLPRFYGDCVFFLTAADTTKWGKKRPLMLKKYANHEWIQMEDDEYARFHEDAEFYVRLHFPYPHWVKPYTYYQTHSPAYSEGKLDARLLTDGTQLLNEVTIRARRNRLNRIDLHKPVYVIDAYEAGNIAMDAGLITSLHSGESNGSGNWGIGRTSEIARAVTNYLVSDMDMNRHFDTSLYFDSLKYEAFYPNRYDNPYWVNETVSPGTYRTYSRLEYIDKIYIYSDYSPRLEGSERFSQSNQPSVDVSLHAYPDRSRRVTYRDRRYILHGFAFQEDFYHPDYKRNPPKAGQKDYRRTLYWNPDLQLDKNGHAHVTLFNNSQKTRIQVEANGMTSEGGFLYNKK
ncbi:MAG: hypothetical protein IJK45_02835 [Bacteroidaceae bacterium]|nr:hypothetical protein [Bacteroidaceae bacterium]